ncbi:MAG: hypothetical protein JW807_01005 [Spirochaetes bacterium]|nr:hypothetical protein [Spirochaetota bacterium]
MTCLVISCLLPVISTGCLYSHKRVAGLEPHARLIEARNYRVLGEYEAKSSSFNLLWIIPVTPRIDYDRAVNEAVAAMRGDNLIDVRTWMERQFWIVGMVEILHVKGKVIKYEK